VRISVATSALLHLHFHLKEVQEGLSQLVDQTFGMVQISEMEMEELRERISLMIVDLDYFQPKVVQEAILQGLQPCALLPLRITMIQLPLHRA